MLSVLLPVYNYDIRKLIEDIRRQAREEKIEFEIVVIDDASTEDFCRINRSVRNLSNVCYSEEKNNLGRSGIRNKLARKAKFDNLLFIDCDSSIIRSDYIRNYIKYIGQTEVIYGGREYSKNMADEICKLHYIYGLNREQATAKQRSIEPNRSFQTNNFLIKKKVVTDIGFNEQIAGYGHEDTLFGYELKKRGITIMHIDNPIEHLGLESNEEFLRKTREGIENLNRILQFNGSEEKLAKDITILTYYKTLKKFRLKKAAQIFFYRFEHLLRKNLLGNNPKLFVFDLYKLGYLCSVNV